MDFKNINMKELWIKKTIWRRYLIKDVDVAIVKAHLKDSRGANVEEIENTYDRNKKIEYDDEETILPVQYDIQDCTSSYFPRNEIYTTQNAGTKSKQIILNEHLCGIDVGESNDAILRAMEEHAEQKMSSLLVKKLDKK